MSTEENKKIMLSTFVLILWGLTGSHLLTPSCRALSSCCGWIAPDWRISRMNRSNIYLREWKHTFICNFADFLEIWLKFAGHLSGKLVTPGCHLLYLQMASLRHGHTELLRALSVFYLLSLPDHLVTSRRLLGNVDLGRNTELLFNFPT